MKEKNSPFRIIFFAILIVLIILGVFVFSLQRQSATPAGVAVVIWGDLDERILDNLVEKINKEVRDSVNIEYQQIPSGEFEDLLIENLASGTGPDMVLMSDDLLIKHENKLFLINYDFYPQKDYKNTFIEAGDILVRKDGLVGLPYIVDPMVMYWNRSLLNSAGISKPPEYWDELPNMILKLTKKDSALNIQRAGIALGEFKNIKNAKAIFLSLIMQAGNPIISYNFEKTESFGSLDFISTFEERLGYVVRPVETATNFFTEFSNPSKNVYSWNRALPNSEDMFLAGDLAFYFGLASEYENIRKKNPNLNFDVTIMPQSRQSNTGTVYGDMIFLGLIKNSQNLGNAFNTAKILTSQNNIKFLAETLNLPPVRRDLLIDQNSNAALQTFYSSALITKPFLDPDVEKTQQIFTNMIESFVSGRESLSTTISRAGSEIKKLLE